MGKHRKLPDKRAKDMSLPNSLDSQTPLNKQDNYYSFDDEDDMENNTSANSTQSQSYRFWHPMPPEPVNYQNYFMKSIKDYYDKTYSYDKSDLKVSVSLVVLDLYCYQYALWMYGAIVYDLSKKGVVNNLEYEQQEIRFEYLNFIFKHREKNEETKQYCEILCRRILENTDVFLDELLDIPKEFSKDYTRMQVKLQLCEYRYAIRDLEQKLRAREGLFNFSNGVTYELAQIQLEYLKRISHPKNYEKNAADVLAYGEKLLTAIEKKEPFPEPQFSTGRTAYDEMNEKLTELRKSQQNAIGDVLNFYREYNKVESYALNFIVNENLKDEDLKPGNIYVFKEIFQVKVKVKVKSLSGEVAEINEKPLPGEVAEIKENYSFDNIIGCAEVRKQINELLSSSYNVKNKHQKFIDDCMHRVPNLNKEIRKTTVGERALLISRKWLKGRLYTGTYTKQENLIRFVERFALLHSAGLAELCFAFDVEKENSEEKIEQFINQAYNSFENIQDQLVARISEEAKKKATELYQQYVSSDCESDKAKRAIDNFAEYLRGEIKHDVLKLDGLKKKNTLKWKLRLAKEELKKEKAGYDLELKRLKRDLHHVCEEYGFASHLVTSKDPAKLAKAKYEFNLNPEFGISAEKQENRKIKVENSKMATTTAIFFGVGEGVVALFSFLALVSAFMIAFYITIPLAIVVGLVGVGVFGYSYYIGKTDSKNVLDQFRLGRFFIDSKGKEVSLPRKIAMIIFCFLAFCATLAFANISVTTLYSAVLPFLVIKGLTGLALLTVGSLMVAGPFAFIALGFFCMFVVAASDFIKEARWKDIQKYFRNKFYAPWSEMSHGARALHLLECAFNVFKIILAVALSVVVNILTLGLFYGKTVIMLSWIVNTPSLSSFVTHVSIVVTNTVNFIFGVRETDRLFESITLKDVLAVTLKSIPFIVNVVVRVITSPLAVGDWVLKKVSNNKIDIANPFTGVFDRIYKKIDQLVGRKPVSQHVTPNTVLQSVVGDTLGAQRPVMRTDVFFNAKAAPADQNALAQRPANNNPAAKSAEAVETVKSPRLLRDQQEVLPKRVFRVQKGSAAFFNGSGLLPSDKVEADDDKNQHPKYLIKK